MLCINRRYLLRTAQAQVCRDQGAAEVTAAVRTCPVRVLLGGSFSVSAQRVPGREPGRARGSRTRCRAAAPLPSEAAPGAGLRLRRVSHVGAPAPSGAVPRSHGQEPRAAVPEGPLLPDRLRAAPRGGGRPRGGAGGGAAAEGAGGSGGRARAGGAAEAALGRAEWGAVGRGREARVRRCPPSSSRGPGASRLPGAEPPSAAARSRPCPARGPARRPGPAGAPHPALRAPAACLCVCPAGVLRASRHGAGSGWGRPIVHRSLVLDLSVTDGKRSWNLLEWVALVLEVKAYFLLGK